MLKQDAVLLSAVAAAGILFLGFSIYSYHIYENNQELESEKADISQSLGEYRSSYRNLSQNHSQLQKDYSQVQQENSELRNFSNMAVLRARVNQFYDLEKEHRHQLRVYIHNYGGKSPEYADIVCDITGPVTSNTLDDVKHAETHRATNITERGTSVTQFKLDASDLIGELYSSCYVYDCGEDCIELTRELPYWNMYIDGLLEKAN